MDISNEKTGTQTAEISGLGVKITVSSSKINFARHATYNIAIMQWATPDCQGNPIVQFAISLWNTEYDPRGILARNVFNAALYLFHTDSLIKPVVNMKDVEQRLRLLVKSMSAALKEDDAAVTNLASESHVGKVIREFKA